MSLKRGRKHYMETTPNFLLCSYISLRTKNVLADYFQQDFYHLGICQKFRKQFSVPRFFFILQYALHVVLDIPQTGNFSLLIKYILPEGQGPVQIRVIIQYKNVTASGPQPGEFFNFSLSLRECSDVCPTKVKTDPAKDYFLLKNGLWMINITSAQPIQGLQLVNKVFVIPFYRAH